MWDSMHQRKLSKSTLKSLTGVKISPRNDKLPAVAARLKPATRRFEDKIQQSIPKGQKNHADTISFLERIMTNQDEIKTLHNAFTRKKNSLYVWSIVNSEENVKMFKNDYSWDILELYLNY